MSGMLIPSMFSIKYKYKLRFINKFLKIYHFNEANIFLLFYLQSFLWSSFISLLRFLFRMTCSKTNLFLAKTPSLKSGYLYLYFFLRGFKSSINFILSRSKGAVSSYSFKNIFYSFLYLWLFEICYFIRLLRDVMFLWVKGILKLVLCLFVFFSTFFPRSWRSIIYF